MCGICGWIDFDNPPARATIQTMTDTMAHRGPDQQGLWVGPHAALGHRRLAVIDIDGGRQPMADAAVLVHSGEIYNYLELRRHLPGCTTRSDTEVLLRGYLTWGDDLLDKLNGMYAFAIWDPRTEELLLVRDRLGIKPLYYFPLPHGVLFASEPKAIFASGLAEPALDREGLLEMVSMIRTPGQAVFKGMHEVKPGHIVRLGRCGLTERPYWSLPSHLHGDDLPTTIRTIREMLEGIIEQQLIADVPLCALLGGGLDSSTIVALAQQVLNRTGRQALRSFSVELDFQPDEMRQTPDAPYVHDVADKTGTEHSDIRLDALELSSAHAWKATLEARDMPPLGDMDTSLYLLAKAIREHSTVALSGEGADELFGGYAWFHDALSVGADTFPWLAMTRRLGRQAIYEPRLNGLDIVGYQAQRYAQALDELPRLAGESPHERRMREICYLHLTRFLPLPLERKDRMSMAVGLEVRVPFLDHRLVEYVYNAPWAMKTFDGREKSLLRAAAADLLPVSVLSRAKSPYPTTHDPRYHLQLRQAVSVMLADGTAPVFSLLNRPAIRALAAMPANGAQVVRLGLERVLRINDWLERYQIRIEV